ncbi:MAG: LysR family transcriptional regulator [Sciscionella sp.]
MDVAWLESFLALLEHGSFTRAAEAQHLSQPAFSRSIRALEQWFGSDLVDRSTFPVALTPAGVKVRRRAQDTVAGLAAARDEIRGRQLMPQDALRVSTSHTLSTTYFTGWWRRVAGERGIGCLLSPCNTLEGYDALVHGGCDLLLAYADPAHPLGIDGADIEWLVVGHDRLAPYSALRGRRAEFRLPGTAGAPVPLVSHGQGSFLGRVTERLLSGRTMNLRPVVQSDLTAALAQLVYAGVGIGWLPGQLAEPAVVAGDVARLGDAALCAKLEIRLLRRRNGKTGGAAATVWDRAAELVAANASGG